VNLKLRQVLRLPLDVTYKQESKCQCFKKIKESFRHIDFSLPASFPTDHPKTY